MAGPTATILVANDLTPTQIRFLGDTIHSISSDVCGDDFSVTTTRPIGGSRELVGRPFVSSSGRLGNPLTFGYADSELQQISRLLYVAPIVSLTFSAMCNDQLDHIILARLCSHIAIEFGGVVDLNGNVECDANEHAGLHTIDCQNYLHQTTSRHICRPEFLADYLTHGGFRMVK